MKNFIYKNRLIFVFVNKALIVVGALLLAFYLRFDFAIPSIYWSEILVLLPALLAIKLVVFWQTGLHKGWWRYVSMPDLSHLFIGNFLASLIFLAYVVFVHGLENIPRSILFLDGLLCFMLMGGVRFLTRALRETFLPMMRSEVGNPRRVLIVGAGEAGQSIVREIRANKLLNYVVVGFVDDDPLKKRGLFQGIKVLGSQSAIESLALAYAIDEIIIAIPSATAAQVQKIVGCCNLSHLKFKILPGVGELINGQVSLQQLHDVNLDDLLGRDPISLDNRQISAYLQNKRVLVTGAGGSIGSEICRQIAKFSPQKLILFENGETPLFHIEQELLNHFPDLHLVPIIGDVRNRSRVEAIFDEQQPQVVFHAAAYKHVPMMEMNPAEAVNNNIGGTKLVADAAYSAKVETFVMISTDKAVRPTNVMGATKRVAELYVQLLARTSKTCFVTTRFGNVLGSNGSVIPTFRGQISKGGPLTVTHPDVTRFFMTIPEAAQLVLQAGSMGHGGEIFLFDMGEPVRIVDLAEHLIRLSGLVPYKDINIVFSGLRPGEKLYEELLLADEGVLPTPHKKICVARSCVPPADAFQVQLEELLSYAKTADFVGIRQSLQALVPEYTPELTLPANRYSHQSKFGV